MRVGAVTPQSAGSRCRDRAKPPPGHQFPFSSEARLATRYPSPMKTAVLAVVALLALSSGSVAQSASTVFRGRPSVKISEGGVERTPEALTRERAVNLECVISQIGGSFYWASRENVQLTRIESGSYVTFTATNGSGYLRLIKVDAKKGAAALGGPEAEFDYVEHLLIGLRSVTYYGTRQ